MWKIGRKNVGQIGGGESNGGQQNDSASSKGWNTPWWVFHLIKLLYELSPAAARILGFLIAAVVWLANFTWTVVRTVALFLIRMSKWTIGLMVAAGMIYLFSTTKMEIPSYLVFGPPVVALIILGIVFFFARRKKDTTDDDEERDSPESPEKTRWEKFGDWFNRWWTRGRVLPILVCFALIHLAIYKLAPNWWLGHMLNQWSVLFQIAIGVAASVQPEDKRNPTKHTFSAVAVKLLAATFIIHLIGWDMEAAIARKMAWWNNTDARGATSPPTNFIIPNGTPDCFKEKLGPDKDAAYAAFPGQMDLMAVFCRESRFYHLGSYGKALTNVNDNGSVDTGIAQINSTHDAKLTELGLDKNKLEDNLKYAGILYEKNGLRDWIPKIGEKLVFEVEVSDEWSNTFKMPQVDPTQRPFSYGLKWSEGSTLIVAIDDESQIVTAGNGDNIGYPKKNYKFKSGVAGKKVLVTVTYQY